MSTDSTIANTEGENQRDA